jgi:hypothetical protein
MVDSKLTDLLSALVADCPKRRSVNIYHRCNAVLQRRGLGGGLGPHETLK